MVFSDQTLGNLQASDPVSAAQILGAFNHWDDIEVNIRGDNLRSLAVVERLGLRDEGVRERFLHIDGQWRDHRTFAVTSDELAERGTLTARLSQT